MKALIPLIATVTLGCASHAQPAFKPVPPAPPKGIAVVAQAPAPAPLPGPAALPATPAAPLPPAHPTVRGAYVWDSAVKFGSSSSSRRTLIIPKGEPKPDMLAEAEEDLNVMTLILEKALEQRGEDEGRKALGIDVFSSSSGIRNMLIEGYGAIFTLKTKIALVPPPAPTKAETKTKDTTTSEWEETRRQLYGPSEIEREIKRAFGKVQMEFGGGSEEYDEDKVRRLKESLIDSLKSASNIRHLSGDQTVTVAVLSSSSVHEVRKIVAEAGRGGSRRVEAYAKAERESSDHIRTGSRLLLQAKKTDIDAYAKGKLNTESFREKVKVQVY